MESAVTITNAFRKKGYTISKVKEIWDETERLCLLCLLPKKKGVLDDAFQQVAFENRQLLVKVAETETTYQIACIPRDLIFDIWRPKKNWPVSLIGRYPACIVNGQQGEFLRYVISSKRIMDDVLYDLTANDEWEDAYGRLVQWQRDYEVQLAGSAIPADWSAAFMRLSSAIRLMEEQK
jgi:hypothetical protein